MAGKGSGRPTPPAPGRLLSFSRLSNYPSQSSGLHSSVMYRRALEMGNTGRVSWPLPARSTHQACVRPRPSMHHASNPITGVLFEVPTLTAVSEKSKEPLGRSAHREMRRSRPRQTLALSLACPLPPKRSHLVQQLRCPMKKGREAASLGACRWQAARAGCSV